MLNGHFITVNINMKLVGLSVKIITDGFGKGSCTALSWILYILPVALLQHRPMCSDVVREGGGDIVTCSVWGIQLKLKHIKVETFRIYVSSESFPKSSRYAV